MMTVAALGRKYEQWLDRVEPKLNTWANHLVVIFAFSVPVLVEARRTSLVLLLVLFLVRGRIVHYLRAALQDPVVLAFTLYFLVHLIWMVGTDDSSRIGEGIHDAAFLLIPLLFSTFVDRRFIPRITAAYLLGMLVSVAISFGIYAELIAPMIHNGHQGDWRDPTPFHHHTHYGYMLAISALVLLTMVLSKSSSTTVRWVAVFMMSAFVANIFIIAGRSGYAILLILLLLMPWLLYGRKALKPLLIVVLIASVATVVAYQTSSTFKLRADTTKESIDKIVNDRDYHSSVGGRVVITLHALTLLADNWLFGMGTADPTGAILEKIQQENNDLTFISAFLAHPHNEYLNAWLQFGIVGLIASLNIPLQLLRYKNEDHDKTLLFKLIGLSILLYALQDVMVTDLGMLLTVVVLVVTGLRAYPVDNATITRFNIKQGVSYVAAMCLFYLLKQI